MRQIGIMYCSCCVCGFILACGVGVLAGERYFAVCVMVGAVVAIVVGQMVIVGLLVSLIDRWERDMVNFLHAPRRIRNDDQAPLSRTKTAKSPPPVPRSQLR